MAFDTDHPGIRCSSSGQDEETFSLFKRILPLGIAKRPPQLSAAEQLVQLSIRKRATAFVDARDDLETKIGRLSRRLNFLMTESDLWRDKFVTFEQYAEKLSVEARMNCARRSTGSSGKRRGSVAWSR